MVQALDISWLPMIIIVPNHILSRDSGIPARACIGLPCVTLNKIEFEIGSSMLYLRYLRDFLAQRSTVSHQQARVCPTLLAPIRGIHGCKPIPQRGPQRLFLHVMYEFDVKQEDLGLCLRRIL